MTLSEKILDTSSSLSKKQKLLGKFIVDNILDVALMNAPQIARSAGVSEATLTRFVYSLGFNSFAEFLTELRKETINSRNIQFHQESVNEANDEIYKTVFDTEIGLMREALQHIDPEAFEKAVDLLCEADHLLLIGGPIHYALAQYMANFICAFKENVHIITQADMQFVSLLGTVSSKSVALAFSFPRYSSEVQRMTELLAGKHVPIIGVTDSKFSPVIPFSQLHFVMPQKYFVLADACSSVMALIHSFIVAMYTKHQEQYKNKLEKYEENILCADMFVYKEYNFVKQL